MLETKRMRLDDASFLQSRVGTIFVDGFDCLCGELDTHEAIEFWYKNSFGLEVGRDLTFDCFSHVTSDTTFFLCET